MAADADDFKMSLSVFLFCSAGESFNTKAFWKNPAKNLVLNLLKHPSPMLPALGLKVVYITFKTLQAVHKAQTKAAPVYLSYGEIFFFCSSDLLLA